MNLTYFFSLNDGRVIDGGHRGNDAHFINHSCEPNCAVLEHQDGGYSFTRCRIFRAERNLSYDYALIYEERHTPAVKRAVACHFGAPACKGSMLMLKNTARYRSNLARRWPAPAACTCASRAQDGHSCRSAIRYPRDRR